MKHGISSVRGTRRENRNIHEVNWNSFNFQRDFIDDLGKKLGFTQLDDWYSVTQDQIIENGGGGLLDHFKGSPFRLIQSVYPEHRWEVDKMRKKPPGYWNIQENQKGFMDNLRRKLGFTSMDDW